MINPRIDHVKQFTHQIPVSAVELHAALIAMMTIVMVMTLPTLG